jgi:hypothetical protein
MSLRIVSDTFHLTSTPECEDEDPSALIPRKQCQLKQWMKLTEVFALRGEGDWPCSVSQCLPALIKLRVSRGTAMRAARAIQPPASHCRCTFCSRPGRSAVRQRHTAVCAHAAAMASCFSHLKHERMKK